jgi:NAD(P)-dependent dehydrogenase (short-subunit alcohol dehydrogenase family)
LANVVITGANRGIGLALVEAYAAAGDTVFAWARDPASASKLRALADGAGGQVRVAQADVTDDASVAAAAAGIGAAPVDVLLNVAGINPDGNGGANFDFDDWRLAFEVMAVGPFRVALALMRNLEAAGGRIVTVTSQIGASNWSSGGWYAYGAAKAAVNRAMKSFAVDAKPHGISVALIHPGHVRTRMGGGTAPLSPEQSAASIRKVAAGLDLANSGSFFNWNGELHPW